METSPILLRLKQVLIGIVILGGIAAFIAPPLLAIDNAVRQGQFDAHILSPAAGMGMAGRPRVRGRVQDETDRVFWIALPSTSITAPDTPLTIQIWCETEAFESCTARYWGRSS